MCARKGYSRDGIHGLQPLNQANNPQKHENPSSYAAGWSFAVPTMSRITMSPIFQLPIFILPPILRPTRGRYDII